MRSVLEQESGEHVTLAECIQRLHALEIGA